jgi:hypothetical protein
VCSVSCGGLGRDDLILAISELIYFRDTQPISAPFQALLRLCSVALPGGFPTLQVRPCAAPSHGSGSGWFATPFLYDSFIHYFTPVYPDAIQAENLPHLLTLPYDTGLAGRGKASTRLSTRQTQSVRATCRNESVFAE